MGALRIQVTDTDWEAPLSETTVTLVEAERKAVTGADGGVFFEQLPFGTYTVLVSRPGFERKLVRQVTVAPGAVQRVDVPLTAVYTEMDEFVVKDFDIATGSDTALIELKMTSAAAIDAVSADTIKRAGASDAAAALKLVAGATVQDGKYAVIRGLPDRYVSSQLNGIRLPSADADKRAVQLDQFPSSMIESIQVHKTFMPDQQGDASGGAVDIRLKRVPDKAVLSASVGSAYNDQITGKKMLTSKGGGVSYWGMDDGDLDRPFRVGDVASAKSIPSKSAWNTYSADKKQEWLDSWSLSDRQTRAFSEDYGSSYKTAEPGTRWSATAGDSVSLADDVKIGMLGTFSYKSDMTGYDKGIYNTWVARESDTGDSLEFGRPNYASSAATYETERGKESVLWGGTAAVGFESPWSNIGLTYTRSQATDYTVTRSIDQSQYDAQTGQGSIWRSQSLYYSERTTETTMLQAEHPWLFVPEETPLFGWKKFALLRPATDWSVSRNIAAQYEPDRRLFNDVYNNGAWRSPSGSMTPLERRWRDIEESGWQYALNQKVPFRQWTDTEGYVKTGYFEDQVVRAYEQDTFIYKPGNVGTSVTGDPDDLWSDDFLTGYPVIGAPPSTQRGWYVAQGDTDIDYRGRQDIQAWYVMGDLPLASFLSMQGGARVETTELSAKMRPSKGDYNGFFSVLSVKNDPINKTEYVYKKQITSDQQLSEFAPKLEQDDVLPALGFKVSPVEKVNVRLNWSQTVARPTFKELMPVEFKESSASSTYFGNPNLKMSSIENYDARIEYMPSAGQIWSASYFFKKLTDPIDMRAFNGYVEGEVFVTPVNYPEGRIDGVEFEVRQQVGEWFEWSKGLTVGGNLAVMESELTRTDAEYDLVSAYGAKKTRRMAGQPEHLVGVNLMYDIESWGSAFGLFLTRRGDMLVTGDSVNGDRYVPMIFENPVNTLDFSYAQKIGKIWTLGFRLKNILDPAIEQEYRLEQGGEVLKSSYKLGREYSVSLSCEW